MKSFRIYAVSDEYELCLVSGYTEGYHMFLRNPNDIDTHYAISPLDLTSSEVNAVLAAKVVGDPLEFYRALVQAILANRMYAIPYYFEHYDAEFEYSIPRSRAYNYLLNKGFVKPGQEADLDNYQDALISGFYDEAIREYLDSTSYEEL